MKTGWLAGMIPPEPNAAAELAQRRDELAAILETALDCIIVMDADGRVEEFNPAAERTFGYSRAEMIGAEMAAKIIPPAMREMHRQGLARYLATGEARILGRRIEVSALRADGVEIPCELTITAIGSGARPLFTAYLRDLSEKRALAQQKEASERRLRLLFEQAPMAIQIFAPDGATIAANAAWERLFNAPRQHVIGWNCLTDAQLIASGASAQIAPAFRGEIVQQPPSRYDWRYPDRPDEAPPEKWIGALFYPVMDEQGQVSEVVCMHDDATERIRTERDIHELNAALERQVAERTAELTESQERFYKAFHANPAMMTLTRLRDQVLVDVNDAFCRTSDFTRAGVLGRSLDDLGVWIDLEARRKFEQGLAENGQVRDLEITFRSATGRKDHVLLSAEILELNREPHLLTVALDLAGLKNAEAELHAALAKEKELSQVNAELADRATEAARDLIASREQFSKMFHASPAAMTLMRLADGCYVDVNDAFCRASGHSREQALGRSGDELGFWVHPEERDRFLGTMQAEGRVRDMELTLRARDGRVESYLVSVEIIEINREPHAISVAIDITARKRAEEELHKALARERELSRLKSSFVSMVSHEFRTPLGIILSSSEILDRYLDSLDLEERKEQLGAIGDAVRRMSGLMEQVLMFSRIESGQLGFRPQPLDLTGFCERLRDELVSATGHRCPIRFIAETRLEGAVGDENLLRHILTNLLTNAVKYSTGQDAVRFLARRENGRAVFEVSDRGLGIPAAELEKLFTAFHRARNVADLPGTGLGLVIVRKCLDAHRGDIVFQSVEGEGTTVTVTIPLFPTA